MAVKAVSGHRALAKTGVTDRSVANIMKGAGCPVKGFGSRPNGGNLTQRETQVPRLSHIPTQSLRRQVVVELYSPKSGRSCLMTPEGIVPISKTCRRCHQDRMGSRFFLGAVKEDRQPLSGAGCCGMLAPVEGRDDGRRDC